MTVTKAQLETLQDTGTIVLVLDAGIDSQVAQRWLKLNAPKAVQDLRVLTTLDLSQLQASETICAVFRWPETPAVNQGPDPAGVIRSTPRPDPDLFAEMFVTRPVKVGDYWDRPNAGVRGKVDIARFLEAIAPTLLPYRLDYIDKGEQYPRIMKLSTL